MTRSLLDDAFAHHAWANLRLLDACAELTDEQLTTNVPGTYGSIIDTLRHLVGADAGYLALLTEGRVAAIDEEEEKRLELGQLRTISATHGPAWTELLATNPDPDAPITRHREDGDSVAPVGIRLAQAVHHGTDHRSQVCTALTSLGMEPPEIDVWSYADQDGRLSFTPREG